jgi:glycosyltransferase involved in cell wall biosynthesis
MKNKLRIVFDANPIASPHKAGVGMYSLRLINSLAKKYPDELKLVGYYYDFLARNKADLPKEPNLSYRPIRLCPGKLVNALRRIGLEVPFELLAKVRGDVGLFPNFLSQPSLFRKPTIPIIHDLSFIDLPQYVSDRNRKDLTRSLPKTLSRAKHVITVSEVSKKVISKTFNYPLDQILVTHIPPEKPKKFSNKEIGRVLNKYKIVKPFVLFVGTLEPRKNLEKLLEAYENSEYLKSDFVLVIAGGIDWKFESTVHKINELKDRGLNIIQTGYISINERDMLYSKASLLVFPSHYEGFGMPILEAFSYNLPVCLSDIEIFHEVAGDAALYFDEDNPESIADCLESVLKDSSLVKVLTAKGSKRLLLSSWDKIAEDVYGLLTK